jgi:hypothetical protein
LIYEYIPCFIKTVIAVQKLIEETYVGTETHTHRLQGDVISLLLFFKSKESRLKIS